MKDSYSSLQHCALLFGTPVSREEFDRACALVPRSDYIAHLVGEHPEEAWNSGYAEVASAAQELIDAASHSGAAIYREATLADFARATERATVVILLAHFRGFDFSEQDFLVPPDCIVAAIDNRLHPALACFDPVPREAGLLVEAFNSAVMERRLLNYLPATLGDAGRLSVPIGRVLCPLGRVPRRTRSGALQLGRVRHDDRSAEAQHGAPFALARFDSSCSAVRIDPRNTPPDFVLGRVIY
jgi:hypothetical protein